MDQERMGRITLSHVRRIMMAHPTVIENDADVRKIKNDVDARKD